MDQDPSPILKRNRAQAGAPAANRSDRPMHRTLVLRVVGLVPNLVGAQTPNRQRLGPDLARPRLQEDLKEIDDVAGDLADHAEREGGRVRVVSESGTTPGTARSTSTAACARRATVFQTSPRAGGRVARSWACGAFRT
jgi:hypothetical protein